MCPPCCSERTMDLVLEMCNTRSIHWCGVSGRQLGKLSPAAFLSLPLTLLSSVQGLQVRSTPVGKLTLCCSCALMFCFLSLFVPEHLRIETHGHISEADVRIRRHRTSVCDLSVLVQRELGLLLTFFFFSFLFFCVLETNGPNCGKSAHNADISLFLQLEEEKTVF